jgi:hypothetical protein
MKRRILKNSAVLILLAFLQAHNAVAGTYRELAPTPRSLTDDEQEMAFYLGPFVFQIKNKNLVIPFSSHSSPFDASVCGKPGPRDFERDLCADRPKSVFLKIPLSEADTHETGLSLVSVVTLGYKEDYNIYKGSADDFVLETNSYDGGHLREPSLDTEKYDAVRALPKKEFDNLPNWHRTGGATVFFIAKDKQSPHVISCAVKLDRKDVPPDAPCAARTWFLTDDFPEQRDGKYAFSLEYGFQAAKIDQAPLIETAVIGAVSKFPRFKIKWPVDLP